METFFRIAGLCLIGAVLAVFLKESRRDLGFLLSLSVCTAALFTAAGPLKELTTLYRDMIDWSGLDGETFLPLLRIAGVAAVTRLGAELCRDAGESAIGTLLEISGAVGALLLATPLFRSVWDLLRMLI